MASTNTSNHFKKYEREPRLQTVDNRFITGMVFNETPLMAGSVKELVNFDIDGVSGALIPRPGLKATHFVETRNSYISTSYDALKNYNIVASSVKTESDGNKYGLVVIGEANDILSEGSPYRNKGVLIPVTVHHDTAADKNIGAYQGIPINAGYEAGYIFDARFDKPKQVAIHDLQTDVTALKNITRPVGCFGFNGDFYTVGNILLDDFESRMGIVCTKFVTDTYIPKGSTTMQTTKRYKFEYVTPKELTPKEAVTWGYNMLAENPYNFTCGVHSSAVAITGVLPYVDDVLCMSPLMNQSLTIKVFYTMSAGKTRKFVAEYKELGGTEFIKIGEKSYSAPTIEPKPIEFPFSASAQEIILRVRVIETKTITKPPATEDGEPIIEYVDVEVATMAVGFNFNKDAYGSTANVKPENYDLTNPKGMAYWQNRLIVYNVGEGTGDGANMLFMSDINDPGYFPYPQGADIFEEPILHVTPFLDDLLVFTSSKLFLVSLAEDGTYYTKKCIQNNLNINDWDTHLIQVVKNMVFFKSGNYYYMVVPKANSMTGELVIAPISKNIKPLLDNFKQNVENTLQIVYNYNYSGNDLNLVHYYNYLDFEDVHNVYVFKTASGDYINYVLMYNTMSRTWRTYIYSSSSFITQYVKDATKRGTYISLHHSDGVTEGPYQGVMLQFMEYDLTNSDIMDKLYTDDKATKYTINNIQHLDTGNRDLNSAYKKRFREVQVQVNNLNNALIDLKTRYMLDGIPQWTLSNTLLEQPALASVDTTVCNTFDTPPTLSNGFTSTPTPVVEPMQDYLSYHKQSYWVSGSSTIPKATAWKVRIPLMGKGFVPRLTLTSSSYVSYELTGITWVYRTLYSR